jgi:hypothetical protein
MMVARSAVEVYWRRIKNSEALSPYHSDVVNCSLPVPGQMPNTLMGFFYLVNWLDSPATFAPVVRFTGRIPECEVFDIYTPEAVPFPDVRREFTDGEQNKPFSREIYNDFFAALQDVLPPYATHQSPGESAQNYKDLLYRLEPAVLHSFYQVLNPDFFAWLNGD